MRRTALVILGIAAGLTVLVLVAVAIAVATVDVKSLVAPAQAKVKALTGRDLTIAGPIDLKLGLEPKLVIEDVALANASWGQAPKLASAKRVEVRVALLPLMQKRFEVVELALVDPVIALETDAQGHGNWEFPSAKPSTAPAAPATPGMTAGAGLAAFGIGDLVVTNGALSFRDGATGKTTAVAIERFGMRTRGPGAPVDAEFRGKVDGTAIALTGNVGPLDALRDGRWPYPVAVKGEVAGSPAAMSTKIAAAGNTLTFDDLDLTFGGLALKGKVALVDVPGGRRKLVVDVAAPQWTQAAAPAPAAAKGATTAATPSRFLLPDDPLPLAALNGLDADGSIAVGEVKAHDGLRVTGLKLRFTLANGKLDVSSLDADAFGGHWHGTAKLDAAAAGAPTLALRVDGTNVDLAAILAAAGAPRQIRGGKTRIVADLRTRGSSVHQWASAMSGQLLVDVGSASLVNTTIDAANPIDALSKAVNPFRESDPSTEIRCAVVRLPLADGIARVDRSIALESSKLAVSASGTLDFRNETLDLSLKPRVRAGLNLDVPNLAELVRVSGPFAKPGIQIDSRGAVTAIAKIGAAASTGGLSVLGTTVFQAATDQEDYCQVALGRAPAARGDAPAAASRPATPASPAKPAPPAAEIGKALDRLFKR